MAANIDELLSLNREYLFTQLDQINCNKKIYVVKDIIDILSSTPTRDKSRINNKYTDDHIYIGYAKRDNTLRSVRLFTEQGLIKYLHDGNIQNYIDACAYFNVTPIDKQYEKHKAQFERITKKCINNMYKTSIIISWIYDTRKVISKLDDYDTLNNILEFVTDHETIHIPNPQKIKIIKDYLM